MQPGFAYSRTGQCGVPKSNATVCLNTNKTGTAKEPADASKATNNASLPLIREQLKHLFYHQMLQTSFFPPGRKSWETI